VYSHEKNPDESLRVLNSVTETYKGPDYYLLMSDIAHYKGDIEISISQLQRYDTAMANKTFEPATLYHVAEIYKSSGNTEDVKPLKKELLASLYELGPTMVDKIKNL
jgi:hypothetical protein